MKKLNRDSHNDTIRQSLNVIFAITQILGGAFTQLTGIGTSIQSQSAGAETPVIPATYAFSIWGLIFLTALIYAIYQALPSQRENELFRKIGFFTAFAFLGNTIWEIVAQTITFNWPTAIIIFFILIPSLLALFRLTDFKGKISAGERILVYLPVSTLAGWVSAATFANISSVLKQLNYYPLNLSETNLSIGILILAASLAVWVIKRSRGNFLYALAVLWALVAIFIANTTRQPNPMIASITLVLAVVVLISLFFVNKTSSKLFKF